MKTRAMSIVLITLLVPVPAWAQAPDPATPGSDWERAAREAVEEGYKLRVVYLAGGGTNVVIGKAIEYSESAIVLQVDSQPGAGTGLTGTSAPGAVFGHYRVEVPESGIARMERLKRDSIGNGVLIGAAVGAGLGVAVGASMSDTGGEVIAGAAGIAALGAGLGFLFDAASRGETAEPLYDRNPELTEYRFYLSPIASRDHKGALFTIRW